MHGSLHQHWAEGIHDTVLSVTANSDPPLTTAGGAADGLFVFIGGLEVSKLTYLRGDEQLQTEELILELQGKKISGLTSGDVESWLSSLCRTGGPISLRTVRPGKIETSLECCT